MCADDDAFRVLGSSAACSVAAAVVAMEAVSLCEGVANLGHLADERACEQYIRTGAHASVHTSIKLAELDLAVISGVHRFVDLISLRRLARSVSIWQATLHLVNNTAAIRAQLVDSISRRHLSRSISFWKTTLHLIHSTAAIQELRVARLVRRAFDSWTLHSVSARTDRTSAHLLPRLPCSSSPSPLVAYLVSGGGGKT